MGQFEYVMVLISIIIGLGITHLLLGLSGIVDRLASGGKPLRLSLAYFAWLATTFVWLLLFWWWEFRSPKFIEQWTVGLYFFFAAYAITLFLMAALLVPRSWDSVQDLGSHFLARKSWFYPLLFLANAIDIVDTFLKDGWFSTQPVMNYTVWIALAVIPVIGLRSNALRVHSVLGVVAVILQVTSAFSVLPMLGSLIH